MQSTDDRAKPSSPPPTDPQLEQRVAQLEQDVIGLRHDLTALSQDVGTLNQTVTALDQRVTNLEAGASQPPDQPPDQPPGGGTPPEDGQDIIADGKTLYELCANGGQVNLPSGMYHGHAYIDQDTQVTGDTTHITAEGMVLPGGKGIFELHAGVLNLTNLSMSDARVPDGNGASVRVDPGASLVMTNCEVYDCQMGILTADGGHIALSGCYFHDSGNNDGLSHEIYVNGSTFEMHDSEVFAGPETTHAVKIRTPNGHITGSHIKGSPSPSNSGAVLDIPDGGVILVEDTIIETSPGTGNSTLVRYGVESSKYGVPGVTLRSVTVTDAFGTGGVLMAGAHAGGAVLTLENCYYTTANPPKFEGWGSIQGQFSPARRVGE